MKRTVTTDTNFWAEYCPDEREVRRLAVKAFAKCAVDNAQYGIPATDDPRCVSLLEHPKAQEARDKYRACVSEYKQDHLLINPFNFERPIE
jgi:hypothetical protein